MDRNLLGRDGSGEATPGVEKSRRRGKGMSWIWGAVNLPELGLEGEGGQTWTPLGVTPGLWMTPDYCLFNAML